MMSNIIPSTCCVLGITQYITDVLQCGIALATSCMYIRYSHSADWYPVSTALSK